MHGQLSYIRQVRRRLRKLVLDDCQSDNHVFNSNTYEIGAVYCNRVSYLDNSEHRYTHYASCTRASSGPVPARWGESLLRDSAALESAR